MEAIKMSQGNNNVPAASKIIVVILVILVIVSCLILLFILLTPHCCQPDEPHDFGDDYINGTYTADAYALTVGGERVGEGIEIAADPPSVVFGDDFEGDLSAWDSVDDASISTSEQYWGSQSVHFNSSVDDTASLSKNFTTDIEIDSDETVETYFYILADMNWDDDDDDYFVLNVTFASGKSIVYEILGNLSISTPDVKVISAPKTQVTALGMWVGINIQNIDDDYIVQFGSSLPVPDIDAISLVLESEEDENVYLDEMEIAVLPKPITDDHFWKKVPSNEHVTSYFVEVIYGINTSGNINNDSIYKQFKLFVLVRDTDNSSVLLNKTLIQDELSNATVGPNQTWASKAFILPEDDTVLGSGKLTFVFSIKLEVWAQVDNTTDYVYASDIGDDFDSLTFEYVEVDGTLDVIVYAFAGIGISGAGVAVATGIARRKKKKGSGRHVVELSERENLIN
jgi:hypothetical protein